MGSSKFQKYLSWCFVIFFTFLLYARDIGGISINKYLYVIIILLVGSIQNLNFFVATIAFVLPLTCGLPSNYILPILSILLIHKCYRENIEIKKAVFLFIAIYEILHIMITVTGQIDIALIVGYLSALFLFLVLISISSEKIDWGYSVLFFCVGCCILLLCIRANFENILGAEFYAEETRMGNAEKYMNENSSIMMLKTNSNNIGLYSIAAISCAIALYYYKKIHLYIFLLIILSSYICGLLSVSRTWVLSLVLCAASYLFLQRRNIIRNVLFLCLLILGASYYIIVVNPVIMDYFIERFTDDSLQTGGQRTLIFTQYNDYLISHPLAFLFGTGAIYYNDIITEIDHSVHNGLQQIFVCYGMVGFVLFISLYCKYLKKYFIYSEYMSVLPMICIFFFLQSLQFLNPHFEMYPLLAAFFVMKMVKSDRENCKVRIIK